MFALRNALSRSIGIFAPPQGSAISQRAVYIVFRRIYTDIFNPRLGSPLQGRISLVNFRPFTSDIGPLFDKALRFPDGETIRDFVSEHSQLTTAQFQKQRLNIAIATLCADRFAGRKMRDSGITMAVSQIISALSAGKDSATGEEIQQFNLTNSMCVTLYALLPEILKECARKHVAGNSDSIDSNRVSGS